MLHYLKHPTIAATPSRRSFLKMSAGALGGLLLGGFLAKSARFAQAGENGAGNGQAAMPFVRITPDNRVVVIVKHLDMGQGVATGLATLVADELDAAVEQVEVEFAPANAEIYKNLLFGIQGTGGSSSMANSYEQYRQAGATARAMLVAAAGKIWDVPASQIEIDNGRVVHGDRAFSFGELANAAADQPVPSDVVLKSPDQWRYIGKGFPRVDVAQKTTGSVGLFGMDVQLPDGLVALTARPPRFGGKVASLDASDSLALDGVVDVLQIPQGIVVIADNTWRAMQGRDLLAIEWDFSEAENRGTAELTAEYERLLGQEGKTAVSRGDAGSGLKNAARVVEAEYSFPYLAHTPMEPLSVTVLYDGETAQLWTGSQLQTMDHAVSAQILGLDMANVRIHTVWGGGSFGRRAIADSHYVAEAAMIGKAWFDKTGSARAIKMIYSREDDVKGGYYRPMHMHKVRAGVDEKGRIIGWQHRVVGQGIMIGTAFESFAVHDGVDHSSIEGAADTTYDLTDFHMDVHHPDVGVPVLWWRAVGHTHTAYVMETMMDELAEAAGRDPVEFRLAHLQNDSRLANVLRLAADKAGWNTPIAAGRGRGVAVHKSFNSYVAEIAEVSLRDDRTVKVEKVVCAVDCGVPINPDNIRAQVEGGLGYGLSAILREEITLTSGEVDQWNFPDYTPMRITDMPEVEVHIVASNAAPTGIGEPGTPPIGPAVANAIAKATGQRVRALPMSRHGLA